MQLRLRRIALSLLLASLGGCTGAVDQPTPGSAVVDTLPSGRILVRVAAEGHVPRWELQEQLRIGAVDGEGPDLFGEVRDLELGSGGEVLVLDGQSSEVRVFGQNGAYLRTLGRPGQGPGELNRPAGMTLDRDGMLWVMNWGNARYTAFDPTTGEVVEEHQRLASFVAIPWPGAFDAEGRLLDVGLDRTSEPVILRLDPGFVPSDTLPFPQPDPGHRILIRRGDTPLMSASDPFAPQPSWTPASGGIVVGEGSAYRLHHIAFGGDTTRTLDVSASRATVTVAERDSVLAAFMDLVASAGGTPERQPRIPDLKPAHGPLLVDDQERVWVQRVPPAGEAPGWDVFGPEGQLLAQVRLPIGMEATLRAIRGGLLAVSLELEGVPTVIVYRILDASP